MRKKGQGILVNLYLVNLSTEFYSERKNLSASDAKRFG